MHTCSSLHSEFVPKSIDVPKLHATWKGAAPERIQTHIVEGIDHAATGDPTELLSVMLDFIQKIIAN